MLYATETVMHPKCHPSIHPTRYSLKMNIQIINHAYLIQTCMRYLLIQTDIDTLFSNICSLFPLGSLKPIKIHSKYKTFMRDETQHWICMIYIMQMNDEELYHVRNYQNIFFVSCDKLEWHKHILVSNDFHFSSYFKWIFI